jgi:hypothetical protein
VEHEDFMNKKHWAMSSISKNGLDRVIAIPRFALLATWMIGALISFFLPETTLPRTWVNALNFLGSATKCRVHRESLWYTKYHQHNTNIMEESDVSDVMQADTLDERWT